jgi:hypothetical protein
MAHSFWSGARDFARFAFWLVAGWLHRFVHLVAKIFCTPLW